MTRIEHEVYEYDRLEAEIKRLYDKAQALRLLADDDPKKADLTKLVDQINALRVKQAAQPPKPEATPAIDDVPDAELEPPDAGNAAIEGGDAKKGKK